MKSKRGAAPESATASVATLILLILLFLLAYLVLLPKEAREDVLEGRNISFDDFNGNGDDNGDNGDVDKEVLLLREPGVVLPPGKNEVKKDFASINLMETSQRSARKLADRITVSRTLFNNNYKDVVFEIEDKDERLKLESEVISAISLCEECGAGDNWLGKSSPKEKIRKSGLWLVNELYKKPLDEKGFDFLKEIVRDTY